MSEPPTEERRLCPTRENGAASLIAHWIAPSVCLQRQRANYHKCPTCRYLGLALDARLAPAVPPPPPDEAEPVRAVPLPKPVPAPRRKRPTKRRTTRVKVSRAS